MMKMFSVVRKTSDLGLASYKTSIFLNVCNLFKIRIKTYYMIYKRFTTVPASWHTARTASTANVQSEITYKHIYRGEY